VGGSEFYLTKRKKRGGIWEDSFTSGSTRRDQREKTDLQLPRKELLPLGEGEKKGLHRSSPKEKKPGTLTLLKEKVRLDLDKRVKNTQKIAKAQKQ